MTTYTVTITPDDPAQAVTTIRLSLDGATTTVRELRLSPGSGGSLAPGDLPVLDLNQLVAAVLAATAGPAPVAAPAKASRRTPAVPASAPGELEIQAPAATEAVAPKKSARKRTSAQPAATPAAAPADAAVRPVAEKTAAGSAVEAGTGKAGAGKSSAGKAEPTKAASAAEKTTTGATKAGAGKAVRAKASARAAAATVREKKAAPAKATARKAASSTPDTGRPNGASRSYRKLPEDFEQVLRQAGDSASVIADHYDVPRHTAYGWIRTARKKATAV
ncbi:hypothetical protein [Catellatospora citrea]|uniref:Uncharacterized protein n=1 Tax=Catellatospora citrea TaxID=53366 RepID=A0A8J3NXQ7_9ACTN|nr:hypothetical protein [Catellatospora citrea]RKE12778.1 hypothetical protein C8E86_7722 [Catellatospora citrea]GIF95981.1 hypothetical protein Cci01nite_10750 [Catellatospora citrea]